MAGARTARWDEGETTLVAGEAATAAGLSVVMRTLATGGRAALTEHDGPGRLLRRLARGGFDRLWATGPQLNLLAARLTPDAPLAPLRCVEATGGALHPPAAARLAAALGAGIATSFVGHRGRRSGQRPGHRRRLPPTGASTSAGRSTGPSRCSTARAVRWRPARSAKSTIGGRLVPGGPVVTGDLARRDGERSLWFEGRLSDRFDCGEATISPVLLEAALGAHPELVDVAIVPRPHPELGMIPVAVTVPLDPEAPPFLADLAPLLADAAAGVAATGPGRARPSAVDRIGSAASADAGLRRSRPLRPGRVEPQPQPQRQSQPQLEPQTPG